MKNAIGVWSPPRTRAQPPAVSPSGSRSHAQRSRRVSGAAATPPTVSIWSVEDAATGEVLTPECLPEAVRGGVPLPGRGEDGALGLAGLVAGLLRAGEPDVYRKASLEADRVILEAVLRHTRGNQAQASELLGISRTTLRAKLRALGLALEKQVLPEAGRAG